MDIGIHCVSMSDPLYLLVYPPVHLKSERASSISHPRDQEQEQAHHSCRLQKHEHYYPGKATHNFKNMFDIEH